jgi:alpha-amylase/alpha-mannosidase (GH57 family)
MKKVYLAFLWHQHQPIYRNPITGVYELPWVRLHATKDYYDMIAILDNYPNVKLNINLVPSLLIQIEEYASGKAKDKFLDFTLKDAQDLTEDEKVFILMNFFMANWDTMIAPYERYVQLLDKRGRQTNEEEIRKNLVNFTIEDFRDLQVWFNLAWMDPYWRKTDDVVAYLYTKGKGFTEEDKSKLIKKQFQICGMIIQKHKEMQDKGQIEVSITPFYHPILPLLCDTNSAHEATPEMNLPSRRFSHSEDAIWHINNSITYYERLFGRKPNGMWPSEGSVSNMVANLISDAGIKWIATDEFVLFNSVKDINGDRRNLFRPFKLSINNKNLNAIFRDHGLSDSIGFVYSKWNAEDAANDFVNRIKSIGEYAQTVCEMPLISVILDGDNCWEYYKNDGWDFLTKLYEKLNSDSIIETVRINDYLEKFPPNFTITNLTAGSWINGNFGVWIGHSEDNNSWDCLGTTRDFLVDFINKNPHLRGSDIEKEAWKNLYAAEGSDWNWWYGDDHSSGNDATFDFIYRQHLMKIYEILGQQPPYFLYKAIKTSNVRKYNIIRPLSFISPKIDGKITDFSEWKNSGYYEVGRDGGSMHQVTSVIKSFNYGFDMQNLYIKIDLHKDGLMNSLKYFQINIIFLVPINLKAILEFDSSDRLSKFIINGKDMDITKVAFEKNIELSIPFEELALPEQYDKIEFVISINENNLEIEKWPYQSTIVIPKPVKDFNFLNWIA